MQNKKIIAIDPGYDRCGVAIFSIESRPELLFSTCITTNPKSPHSIRLKEIHVGLKEIIEEQEPQLLAVETLFFSLNKKTAIKVAEARGVILLTAEEAGLEILEISPQLVKLSTTGQGNSDKKAVQKMVAMLVKTPLEKKLDDEIDAIAIGLAALEELRIRKLTR